MEKAKRPCCRPGKVCCLIVFNYSFGSKETKAAEAHGRQTDGRTVVSKGWNPPKISWSQVISRVFPSKVSENSITSVSGHGLHYIFKTCQFVTGTSMVRQLHNFFHSNFWCVFDVWAKCGTDGRSRSVLRTNKGRKARQRLRRPWRLCDEEAKKPYDFSSWQRGWIKQPRKVEHTVSPEGVKLQLVWNKR